MNKIRDFLWKYLGITLDRKTLIVIGIVVLSCVLTIVFGILSENMNNSVFRVLAFVAAIPIVLIIVGSSNNVARWSLSGKNERQEIEEKIALDQLKRRANDKHFQR
jgi:Ni/Fe-hydrogenase subunit HybB-like protein